MDARLLKDGIKDCNARNIFPSFNGAPVCHNDRGMGSRYMTGSCQVGMGISHGSGIHWTTACNLKVLAHKDVTKC
jgi:hypothetical protein